MQKICRGLASAAGVAALALTALVPAAAAQPERIDNIWLSGETAHVGELDGFAGNAHLISYYARTTGHGDASVVNFDCPEGQTPSWDPDSGCEVLGALGLYGTELDVDIDQKLSKGTVSGMVRVYEGENESGEPIWGEGRQLEVTMEATGDAVATGKRRGGFVYWSKDRPATATSGQLGELDLTGAVGNISHLRESYKN